jgi:hypothetical protein
MNRTLLSMALMRFISAFIEFFAAVLFLKMNSLESAIRINAALGIVGPFVFMAVGLLGLSGISTRISWIKMIIIFAGIALVLVGTQAD